MKKICAWCTKEIAADPDGSDKELSHGICTECRDYFFSPEGPPTFAAFLDQLAVPVLVVDDDVRVLAGNQLARRTFGRKLEGLSGGEAIECPYARLPGGCGKQIHCKSCAIRLTVLDTYVTGQSHYDVPAYRDDCTGTSAKCICFLISTEKAGEYVFLKIVEIKGKKCKGKMPRHRTTKRPHAGQHGHSGLR